MKFTVKKLISLAFAAILATTLSTFTASATDAAPTVNATVDENGDIILHVQAAAPGTPGTFWELLVSADWSSTPELHARGGHPPTISFLHPHAPRSYGASTSRLSLGDTIVENMSVCAPLGYPMDLTVKIQGQCVDARAEVSAHVRSFNADSGLVSPSTDPVTGQQMQIVRLKHPLLARKIEGVGCWIDFYWDGDTLVANHLDHAEEEETNDETDDRP